MCCVLCHGSLAIYISSMDESWIYRLRSAMLTGNRYAVVLHMEGPHVCGRVLGSGWELTKEGSSGSTSRCLVPEWRGWGTFYVEHVGRSCRGFELDVIRMFLSGYAAEVRGN